MRKTVDVEIDIDDVVEYIEDHACHGDLETIRNLVIEEDAVVKTTIVEDMKSQLLNSAFRKFSLDELETKLGITYLD